MLRVHCRAEPGFNCAAPFRERLLRTAGLDGGERYRASIVPLPFGSGYPAELLADLKASLERFNCAAPFRERLSEGEVGALAYAAGFNCAAPFRERLCRFPRRPRSLAADSFNCAAPFRERLFRITGEIEPLPGSLQLCRSLSGAVIWCIRPRPRNGACFNCAAPFRERLCPHRPCKYQPFCRASIVPLPFGSGYTRPSTLGTRCRCRFNCAAPFRERLS